MRDYIQICNEYAQNCIDGTIPVGKLVRLACKRHLDDLAKQNDSSFEWRFDENKAIKPCKFAEMQVHVKGEWAGNFIELAPWQVFIFCNLFGWISKNDGYRKYRECYIEVPRKNGKALALDTIIPTPDGFKTMGELEKGDRVYGTDGKICNVVETTEILYDRPCYELTFIDGTKVIADANHEWITDARKDRDSKTRQPKPSIKTTETIANSVMCRDEHNHRILVCVNGTENTEKDYIIHPYALGIWLGDGDSRNAAFTNPDMEIVDNLLKLGLPIRKLLSKYRYNISDGIKNSNQFKEKDCFRTRLRKLNVLQNKHIPEEYFLGSYNQRLELLQGLMDTDGYANPKGQCEFVQKSKLLAEQVCCLVNGLGMRATIKEKRAFCNGKDCGIYYRVMFHAYKSKPVFKLKRKLERLADENNLIHLSRQLYRTITNCKPVESVPVKCIQVDSPDHCYLITKSYIRTHNSVLAATLANYMFLGSGEEGAEVYSGATTEKQAWEVFRPAKQMIEKSPGLKAFFGVEIFAKSMFYARKLCRFEPVIGKPGDGASPSCAIVDEYHEHQTSDLVDTMLTGMGARREPLLIEITTAGTNTSGPCKIQHDFVENILLGKIKKDRMFGIIYTIDKDDDWADFEVWKKANPNYGISINDEFLKEQYLTATQKVSQQNIIRCKHLNQWLSVDTSWIDMLKLRNCIDKNLKVTDMKGKRCVIGLDLATKIDVATVCLCFWDNGNYYSFNKFYLPRTTVERPENQHYQTWEKEGILTVTEGAVIDYSVIESDIVELYNTFNCEGVAFDPWQATQLSQNLEKQGLVMIETRAVVGNFSEPMKELEGAIYSNKYHFDGNAMMEWMFSNVVAHYDRKDNIYPNKARNENKIDGVVALIMCLNLVIRLNNKEEEEEAGFAFF